jgi:diketogulonate reductase-like aldo/keto reductase
MRTLKLPSGEAIPVLGQGTWQLGEKRTHRNGEIQALRLGLDLGMTMIDTAEMYGDGAAEQLVGDAIAGRRDDVFLVSKVLPSHATRKKTIQACEHSLVRLKTDRLDLYLLHWRGPVKLSETLAAFSDLVAAGKIRYWGVSNFDVTDLEELQRIPGGEHVATDQVLYNLSRRGIEYDLLPRCRRHGLPIMAYSPIEQGKLVGNPVLQNIATRHRATATQIALAWVIRNEPVMAIPRASTAAHVRENHGALSIQLTQQDLADLDRAFPTPTSPRPLEMI